MPGQSSPWKGPTLRGSSQFGLYHSKRGVHMPLKYRRATMRVHVLGCLADSTGDPILKQALKVSNNYKLNASSNLM